MRLLFASTVPVTVNLFMRGQLSWLVGQGYDVHVVSSPGPELLDIRDREGVTVHALSMRRDISVFADVRSLVAWVRLVRRLRPDVAVVSTPKAGLIGGIAARIGGVPRCVYLYRGARFESATGLQRVVLALADRMACAAAHQVIAVSDSLAAIAISGGIVSARKVITVGAGSSNGVDLVRFHPPCSEEKIAARAAWEIAPDQVVVAFVGRLTEDKGLRELEVAVSRLSELPLRVLLLIAGTSEGAVLAVRAGGNVAVRTVGHVEDVPGLLSAADVLVLPTRREGFPNVVLEAAASGLPVVTTCVTGAVDSVVDGVTGLLVPANDGISLAVALESLLIDRALRLEMGRAGRARAERDFASDLVWRGMLGAYLGTSKSASKVRCTGGSHEAAR